MRNRTQHRLSLLLLLLLLGSRGGASENPPELFQGQQVPAPNERLHSQTENNLRITTAVPSAEEAEDIFGTDLYRRNVQPVWVQVENLGQESLMLTPMGLDPGYYTGREAATRTRAGNRAVPRNKDFEQREMTQLGVGPLSIQSGYIFSQVDEGSKSFNVDVLGGAKPYRMTFFVPVPGLKVDHHDANLQEKYSEDELRHVTLVELRTELEAMPCCVTDKSGQSLGDPLNLVFIGEILDVYYTFLRAGWDETETIYGASMLKTAASALTGGRYRYSPVSALYVFGRPQDVAMQRARASIHERNHLRIWLTPLRLEGKPVWIGQISRDIGVRFTWKTITTHKIDPNVDETRDFLVEDLAYADSLLKIGYVGGVGAASYDKPRSNLTGDPYFSDGRRAVLWVSGEPTGISEIERLDFDKTE